LKPFALVLFRTPAILVDKTFAGKVFFGLVLFEKTTVGQMDAFLNHNICFKG